MRRPIVRLVILVAALLSLYAGCRLLTGDTQEFGILGYDGSRRAIILVHGLDEPGILWRTLEPHLRRKQDWPVFEFVYPNAQGIAESSRFLADELKRTDLREVIFIAHSMGSIVVRELLSEPQHESFSTGRQLSVNGVVLIAPPNRGSNLARYRAGLELKETVHRLTDPTLKLVDPWMKTAGKAGQDLTPGSEFLDALNARKWPESVPVFMIVGYDSPVDFRSTERKQQLLSEYLETRELPDFPFPEIVDGYGDGSVSLESALHPDFPDYLLLDAIHRPIVDAPETVAKIDELLAGWTK